MACATLKRSHNFDLLDSSPKRRRFYNSCSPTFSDSLPASTSPFVSKEQTTQVQLKRRIKEEIKRLQRRRLIPRFLGGPAPVVPTTFRSHVRDESTAVASCGSLRSLVLRSPKQDTQDSDSDQSPRNDSFDGPLIASSGGSSCALQNARPIDSVPIFTLTQVTSLCERLVKEREEELREEYDNILLCKLAEQYEAFLKFNHDQLYNRFQNAPMSYVS